MYCLWNVKDTFWFKHELIFLVVFCVPLFSIWAVAYYYDWRGAIYPHLWVDLNSFSVMFASLMMPVIGTFVYTNRINAAKRKYHICPSENSAESGNYSPNAQSREISMVSLNGTSRLEFTTCLQDPILAADFEKFAAQSFCIESLLFYRKVVEFRSAVNAHEQMSQNETFQYHCKLYLGCLLVK